MSKRITINAESDAAAKTGPITKGEITRAAKADGRARAEHYHKLHGRRLDRNTPYSCTEPRWQSGLIIEADGNDSFGELDFDGQEPEWAMSLYVQTYVKAAFAWRPS